MAPASANNGPMNEPRARCMPMRPQRADVPEVADQPAQHDPERVAEQPEADQRTDDLADHFHRARSATGADAIARAIAPTRVDRRCSGREVR